MRSAPVTIFYSVRDHIHSFIIHCHSRVPLSRARAHRKLEFEHGRVNPILCLRDVLCRARRASDYICSFIGPLKCDERIVNHIAIVVCERVLDTLLNWLSHANHGEVYQRAQRALAMNTIHGAIVHFIWNEEEICNDERRTHVCTPTSSWLIVVNVLIGMDTMYAQYAQPNATLHGITERMNAKQPTKREKHEICRRHLVIECM